MAKSAPLGPGLPGFAFFKTTAYTDKDYEGLAFFQPVPSQAGRFKNGPRPTLFKILKYKDANLKNEVIWKFPQCKFVTLKNKKHLSHRAY